MRYPSLPSGRNGTHRNTFSAELVALTTQLRYRRVALAVEGVFGLGVFLWSPIPISANARRVPGYEMNTHGDKFLDDVFGLF